MTLLSMTGYGRSEGSHEDISWVWEVRSVNGKKLDMRLRLPQGYEMLDPKIRKQVGRALTRGNLQISLDITGASGESAYAVNTDLLNTLIDSGAKLVDSGAVDKARLDGLYQVRGVVTENIKSASDPSMTACNEAILSSLDDMLKALVSARRDEGTALQSIMDGFVEAFADLTKDAKQSAGTQAGAIKTKFKNALSELLEEDLPEDKLLQEVAILALKADVREELDRLDAHIEQAQILLKQGSPIGRKLDFLSQEFIREINTLCSKSSDIALTRTGLEMKNLIEQFREQAANVE